MYTQDELDQQVRKQFQRLREREAAGAPDFTRLEVSGSAEISPFTAPWFRIAAAAALLLAVAGPASYLRFNRVATTDWQSWSDLSNWQSSTDQLLAFSATTGNGSSLEMNSSKSETTNQKEEVL
jgi:hypothetical protein